MVNKNLNYTHLFYIRHRDTHTQKQKENQEHNNGRFPTYNDMIVCNQVKHQCPNFIFKNIDNTYIRLRRCCL